MAGLLLLKISIRLSFLRVFSTSPSPSSSPHHQTLLPFFSHPLPHAPPFPSNLLVDEDHLWPLSTKLNESEKSDEARDGHGVDEESSFGFDEVDDMRLRRKLFYKIDRDSKEYDECSIRFYKTKSARNKERVKGRSAAAADRGPFGGETNEMKECSVRGLDSGGEKSIRRNKDQHSNPRLADRGVMGCYSGKFEKSKHGLNCSDEKSIRRNKDQHSNPRLADRSVMGCYSGKFEKSKHGLNCCDEKSIRRNKDQHSNPRLADRSVMGCYSGKFEKSKHGLNCSDEKSIRRNKDQHSNPRLADRGVRDCRIDESGFGRKFEKSKLGLNCSDETNNENKNKNNNVEEYGASDRCCSTMAESRGGDANPDDHHLHMMDGKRVRTPTYNQTTDPYHQPFCLDIYITKGSVRACVVHRVTSKVVVVAHSISKDMKFDLKSRKDSRACAAVGAALAQRAMADDIHDVVYTPRKKEKIEDKLLVVLQAIVDRGINVKVKFKQRSPSLFKKETTKEDELGVESCTPANEPDSNQMH